MWTINPKELTPSITGIATKVYDGTTTVPEENTLAIALTAMCGEDDVSASATSYAYADKNAAEEKNVVASGITLSGAAKDNYKVVATVTTKVGKITKATPAYTNPTDLTGVCGKTLSTVTLPAGFEWSDDTTVKLEAVSSEASSVVTKQ